MIEATQKKLREAQYFLRRLHKEARQADVNEPEAFLFYLSAFLSAGRSVTFALQSEEKEKYDAWFKPWLRNRTDEERQLFDFLKDQRNFEQKQGGARVSTEWEFVPVNEVYRSNHGHTAYRIRWFGPPGAPPPKIGKRVYSFQSGCSTSEVTEMCKKYADLLNELVREFVECWDSPRGHS